MKKSTQWNIVGYFAIFVMGMIAALPMVLAFLGFTKAFWMLFLYMFIAEPILYACANHCQNHYLTEVKKESAS